MNIPDSNAARIADHYLPGMARMVGLEIIIEGKIIGHFKYFHLDQSAVIHHSFELALPHDALNIVQNHRMDEAQHFLGKRITVVFRYRETEHESPERTFVGVVTGVAFSREQMSLGDIVLKGGSPTLLLDAAPHFQSFGGETPVNTAFIAQSIIRQGLGSQKFDIRIATQNKSYINYSAQYNETHYNYLTRLAEAYGEQFYYDGEVLHFGKLPPHEKPIKLIYGSSVSKVSVELNAIYTKQQYFGYNSSRDKKMKGIDRPVKHLGELASQSYNLNENIFTFNTIAPSPINANMDLDIDYSQNSARGSAAVDVFTVSGETTIPFLYPGCVADLEMRKPDSNATSYFTRIIITGISHKVDALGNYSGEFSAIAEGTGFMPKPEFMVPEAAPQIATVVSNEDPLGQGRIRVRFQWQNADASTHFIRMMSPDAGASEAVPLNRGFVAIPEAGDQVMVGFEYSHPDFPFAMGGMFHGKNAKGGGIDNRLKSLQTRSGIKILLDDLEKSITIEDPSGNSYFMDGKGNIRVTAPGNIEFSAGKDILMNSGKNMEIKTGNHLELTAGNTAAFQMMSAALFSVPLMELAVPSHFSLQSGKTSLHSEEATTIQGKTTRLAGMEKLMIHSEQETTVNSKGKTNVLGKDGNNHSNIPRDYNPLEKKMDGRCLVHFRPKENWDGDGFGFDWVRAGDTGMPGDHTYFDIIGRIQNGVFIKDPSEYQKLLATFSYYVYLHTFADGTTEPRPYAFPYLSLYPGSYFRNSGGQQVSIPSVYHNTTAELRVLADLRQAPEAITLEYDPEKFSIIHDPFPLTAGHHEISCRIRCREEFNTKKKIEVFAHYRESDGTMKKILAGGISVKSNHHRYQVPVVFIEVITDIGNGKRSPVSGEGKKYEIQKYLNHALINPVFEDTLKMDCSVDTNPEGIKHNRKSRFNAIAHLFTSNRGIVINGTIDEYSVMHFLRDELHDRYQGKYDSMIKVFFIDERCWNTKGIGSVTLKTAIIYRGGLLASPKSSVTAHEVLHTMGLKHTFDIESRFVFEKHRTDNIMDYSDYVGEENDKPAKYTYQWQWKIMQEHAEREASSRSFRKFNQVYDDINLHF